MTWTFTTSHIGHDGAGGLRLEVCHHRADYGSSFGGVFWLSGPPLGAPELDVSCPSCAADRGLRVSGVWGGPAELACLCGHAWTPRLPGLAPEQFLRQAVRLALDPAGAHLPYRRIRLNPDTTPPSPLRTAVRPLVVEASHALQRREWAFDDYETVVANDLLIRSGRGYDATTDEELSDESRLRWVHDSLSVLREYAQLTAGRLGDFLTACTGALAPAGALSLDDCEPGPAPYDPWPLWDACLALSGVHTVLTAGASGDVDY
ncbi:hypothetical protein P3T35_000480 [Kitasatospora sp. GP30]|uniref:hypothetical protein n=1 Tax=Kitasatospora sp. GP30 TaxID=3035084 RepID=UPI000C701BB9|nr:hypothetical protein [Kitasatospora sp. GP30]MDH6138503.1 hypothetical protein [Kitasatospora sp. GP30]